MTLTEFSEHWMYYSYLGFKWEQLEYVRCYCPLHRNPSKLDQ